jgi:Arc/MetJ-type ribon-helix-helix transcriptional regulator
MYYGCNTEGILMEEKLVSLNVRVPRTLKQLIRDYIELNAHKDISEFTRDALREKIQRDAPSLYKRLFEAEKGGEVT